MSLRGPINSTYAAFTFAGFGFASWASRIPSIRDELDVDPATLGLILLTGAGGSVVALPLAGVIVTRLGTARTVRWMAWLLAFGLLVLGIGTHISVLAAMLGLAVVGFAVGSWDVAMNVHGAAVEQESGRSLMARFHAGFSVGTVVGAALGAGATAIGMPVWGHLCAAGTVVAVGVPAWTRSFLPATAPDPVDGPTRSAFAAWLEPRTVLVGVFVLCAAFTEGTGNDWLAVAMIDGYDTAPAVGTSAFAVFLAAMTTARWFGPGLLERYGRVPVVRVSVAVAFTGLVLVVFGHFTAVAFVGAVLWGTGAALGFPVGMSAAADDPARAAARVSVVGSIGYTAFLAGPPVIGLLGDHVGVLRALTVAVGVLALALLIAGVLRPLEPLPTD